MATAHRPPVPFLWAVGKSQCAPAERRVVQARLVLLADEAKEGPGPRVGHEDARVCGAQVRRGVDARRGRRGA